MQEGKYLWLVTTRDHWGDHPMVFIGGETLDKKALSRRFSLPYQGGNGETLDTLRLGRLDAVQDLTEVQTELDREINRHYRGGS